MHLTTPQLEQIVASALPGQRLRLATDLSLGRIGLTLASGEQFDCYVYQNRAAAQAATAALRRLRGEIDLPVPSLHASDSAGEQLGVPYILASPLAGQPLVQLLGYIPQERLYELGQQLGTLVYRIHRLAYQQYGEIDGTTTYPDEQHYVLARLEQALASAIIAQVIDQDGAAYIRNWFAQAFQPVGGPAALICGSLMIERILVKQAGQRWVLSGVGCWEQAVSWVPAWDHCVLLDSARHSDYFAFRTGYGNAYDAETARSYEQLREAALRPYRVLLALEQATAAIQDWSGAEVPSGNTSEYERNRRLLEVLVR